MRSYGQGCYRGSKRHAAVYCGSVGQLLWATLQKISMSSMQSCCCSIKSCNLQSASSQNILAASPSQCKILATSQFLSCYTWTRLWCRTYLIFCPTFALTKFLCGGVLQYANGECHQVLHTYMKYLQSEESWFVHVQMKFWWILLQPLRNFFCFFCHCFQIHRCCFSMSSKFL